MPGKYNIYSSDFLKLILNRNNIRGKFTLVGTCLKSAKYSYKAIDMMEHRITHLLKKSGECFENVPKISGTSLPLNKRDKYCADSLQHIEVVDLTSSNVIGDSAKSHDFTDSTMNDDVIYPSENYAFIDLSSDSEDIESSSDNDDANQTKSQANSVLMAISDSDDTHLNPSTLNYPIAATDHNYHLISQVTTDNDEIKYLDRQVTKDGDDICDLDLQVTEDNEEIVDFDFQVTGEGKDENDDLDLLVTRINDEIEDVDTRINSVNNNSYLSLFGSKNNADSRHINDIIDLTEDDDTIENDNNLIHLTNTISNFERSLVHCRFCSHSSSSVDRILKHECTHTIVKVFRCEFCNFKTNRERNLEYHERTHVYGKFTRNKQSSRGNKSSRVKNTGKSVTVNSSTSSLVNRFRNQARSYLISAKPIKPQRYHVWAAYNQILKPLLEAHFGHTKKKTKRDLGDCFCKRCSVRLTSPSQFDLHESVHKPCIVQIPKLTTEDVFSRTNLGRQYSVNYNCFVKLERLSKNEIIFYTSSGGNVGRLDYCDYIYCTPNVLKSHC